MYKLATTISSEIALNLIPEVTFHPDGSKFAVSHQQANEVVVYDSRSRGVVRTFRNPDAGIDNPHGVLAVTYCQNVEGPGAVVTYRFNEETGAISGAIDIREACFSDYGQPKGVAFSRHGAEMFITYATQKRMTGLTNYARRVKAARILWRRRNLAEFFRFMRSRAANRLARMLSPPALKNGIAVFAMDNNGELSDVPIRMLERANFCRLENIDIVGDTVILCDTINGRVYLHDLIQDPQLQTPIHEIAESVVLPHGAKLSPDGSMLVVTNYGLKVENQVIHWMTPAQGYTNSVLVYDLLPS